MLPPGTEVSDEPVKPAGLPAKICTVLHRGFSDKRSGYKDLDDRWVGIGVDQV